MTLPVEVDMQDYFSEFGLKLGGLMRAHGLEGEPPLIASAVAAEVLALAGAVAHASERKIAPIASFAAGIAVGRLRAGGRLSSDREVADFIAQLRKELDSRQP